VTIQRQLDMRYPHQGYELALDCPPGSLTSDGLEQLRHDFDALHEQVYGVSAPDELVEIVNVRVRTVVARERHHAALDGAGAEPPDAARTGEREVHFEPAGFVSTPVYDRTLLRPGMRVVGPAIVEQLDATTVIGPRWSGTVDRYGNLPLSKERVEP
jgi:N-methylhydantoinase A